MNRPPLEMGESGREVLERRYLLRDEEGRLGETPEGLFRRVAAAVAAPEARYGEDPEAWGEVFYGLMVRGEFLPNSPTLMNAGTPLGQLAACFVLADAELARLLGDLFLHQRGAHEAGADDIGAHAVFGAFLRHRACQAQQAVLGGDVGGLEL